MGNRYLHRPPAGERALAGGSGAVSSGDEGARNASDYLSRELACKVCPPKRQGLCAGSEDPLRLGHTKPPVVDSRNCVRGLYGAGTKTISGSALIAKAPAIQRDREGRCGGAAGD